MISRCSDCHIVAHSDLFMDVFLTKEFLQKKKLMRNLYEHDNFVGFPMLIFKVTIQIQVSVFPDAFTSE